MKTIGITGGVGAGKSTILNFLEKNYNSIILVADNIAHELEEPGNACYNDLLCLLGNDILDEEGKIIPRKMAEIIFKDQLILQKVNDIVHPAVKEYILNKIEDAKKQGVDYVIVEAALLIEEGYQYILDDMWYVRTSIPVRRQRLKSSRGYSDDKIDSIIANQMTDEEYMKVCDYVIDNDRDFEEVKKQIVDILGETDE